MNNFKMALTNIKMNYKNAKELKASFITTIIGMFINNSAFIILWYSFGKLVDNLNGWSSIDIFGMYGFTMTSFGIIFAFFSGISKLPSYITSGNFDKYLLTPKNTLLKIATSDISTSAIGDLLFGVTCFLIYSFMVKLNIYQIIIYLLFIIIASIVLFSFLLFAMSLSFYFMDGDPISNGIFGIFLSVSTYYGGAFNGILKYIFVFIIPALLNGAILLEFIKSPSILSIIIILLITIFWFVFSIMFFYYSKRKYESNNFFGFGS